MGDFDSERASYHHGNLRQGLLALGLEQLETAGQDGLSLRDLASRLGVSKTAPYRHFPDKAALLRALMDVGWTELRAALVQAKDRETAPDAGLRAMGRAYLEFAGRRANLYRLLFSGKGQALHSDCRCDPETDAFAPLLEQVKLCQAAGWKREADPQLLSLSIWAQVHGAAELSLEGLVPIPEGMQAHEFWATTLETVGRI